MSTPKLLTTSEVADHFRVSTSTVINWIKNGSIPDALALPSGRYRIPETSLAAIVRNSTSKKMPEGVEEII